MQYQLIRSRRKTLAISITADGSLIARAPLFMSAAEIEAFVRQKQAWITRKQQEVQSRAIARFVLSDGATLPFCGETLTVRLANVRSVSRQGDELLVPQRATGNAPIVRWLRAQARSLLPPMVDSLARQMGVRPTRLSLSTAKTRWGSMNTRGEMRLNLALLLTSREIVAYVIVHELAHIPHPDHSAAFWACVERAMPDYRARQAWLKQHGTLIDFLREIPAP